MEMTHPKHGVTVPVDNRRDETRLRALGYVEVTQTPSAQLELFTPEVVAETEPETPDEDEKPSRRTRKSD